ncbi:MAG: 30S ribosomal protein S15 [bacterium]
MSLTKQKTQEIVAKFASKSTDSGSTSVQTALLTERIQYLSRHLKTHSKDHSSQFGLTKLVSRRKRLLKYLENEDREEYKKLIKRLELRK